MFADLTTLANVNESFYQFFLRTHFAFLSFAHLALAAAAIRARPAAEMHGSFPFGNQVSIPLVIKCQVYCGEHSASPKMLNMRCPHCQVPLPEFDLDAIMHMWNCGFTLAEAAAQFQCLTAIAAIERTRMLSEGRGARPSVSACCA
jgi:hypothetical protein